MRLGGGEVLPPVRAGRGRSCARCADRGRHSGAPGRCYDPAGPGSGITKASTEATMAGGRDPWAVRGVASELQRRAVDIAAARGVTVGSIVTDALTARLDALERGAGPADPAVAEVPPDSVPISPVQPCRRRAIWAARGG